MTLLRILIVAALAPYAMPATAVPIAPTELVATPISPTRVDLTWKDNSDNEAVFVIERRASGSSAWTVAWAELNSNFTEFSDMGLAPGARIEYRVKARAKDGLESKPSNIATAVTPTAPPLYNNLLRDRQAFASSFQWRKVPARQAVDGTQWTRWWSKLAIENKPKIDWLQVDMGSRRTIDKIRIVWQRNSWAKKFEIQISDDASHWKTVLAVENSTLQAIEDRQFPEASGRYLRFQGFESAKKTLSWGGYGGYSIYEFEAYAPGVEPDPLEWEDSSAFRKPATASVRATAVPLALDSHMGTFWGTGARRDDGEHAYTVDLGTEQDIYEISPYWHVPAEFYQIRLSSDGEAWRTIADQAAAKVTPVVNEELKEIHTKSFATPERARHVRVVVSGKAMHSDPNFTAILLQELLVHSAPHGAPPAPKNVRATLVSPRRVSLQWDDESTDERGFEVFRRELGTSVWQRLGSVGRNETNYEDSILPPDQEFVYRVRAVNDRGASMDSNNARP